MESGARKELYNKIYAIISNDDDFPIMQADALSKIAQDTDGRLYLFMLMLVVALRVYYWRRAGSLLRRDASNYAENATALEVLNTTD